MKIRTHSKRAEIEFEPAFPATQPRLETTLHKSRVAESPSLYAVD
jgi:hypothetical protein